MRVRLCGIHRRIIRNGIVSGVEHRERRLTVINRNLAGVHGRRLYALNRNLQLGQLAGFNLPPREKTPVIAHMTQSEIGVFLGAVQSVGGSHRRMLAVIAAFHYLIGNIRQPRNRLLQNLTVEKRAVALRHPRPQNTERMRTITVLQRSKILLNLTRGGVHQPIQSKERAKSKGYRHENADNPGS